MALDRARRHELGLLAASRPGLPVLLTLGRRVGSIRRAPGLGWVVGDPATIRRILTDTGHFTIVGEGIVGHLWARVLGDWAYDLLDGAGHHALRTKLRGLFSADGAAGLVERAAGARLRRCTADLAAGRTVDVADLSRVVVGRVVADLLGVRTADNDAVHRGIYGTGVELAALAAGSTASPQLPARTVATGREILAGFRQSDSAGFRQSDSAESGSAGLRRSGSAGATAGATGGVTTGQVATGRRDAPGDTLLGRCRELGLDAHETAGLTTLLTVAGTQTTASAMARTVALLHDTGQQHRLLREPQLLPDAVREGLRVASPVPVITRSVTADVQVAGRWLRAGQRVLMLTHTADNARGGFDLRRPDTRQLSFGAGRHYCLGAPLGQAEVTALLTALLATGRPWRVVDRRYAAGALIPAYRRLRIALV